MSGRIVGLGGSLRTPSASLRALDLALESAAAAGAEVERLDLRALDLPLYDPTRTEVPADAARLARAVAGADGLIWSSPTYHGTVSGAFKNAIDWLQLLADRDAPFLSGKPVGLIATAAGTRGMQAINTMMFVVQALRGWTVPWSVAIGRAHRAFADDGTVTDLAVARRLATLGRDVATAVRRLAA